MLLNWLNADSEIVILGKEKSALNSHMFLIVGRRVEPVITFPVEFKLSLMINKLSLFKYPKMGYMSILRVNTSL